MAKKGAYETQIVISGKLDNSFEGTIGKAKRELQGLYYQQKRQGSTVGGIEQLGSFSDKTFAMVAQASKAAALGGTAILSASTAVGMGYEKQMSVVQSISNATAGEMRKLDEVAQEMGRTTQFSAAEAGKGLEYMAMAGWKADQMTAGLPAILSLAAASGEDLGAVSDIVTDALTAFGLTAEDAAVFSDVLAQASSNSNTNVGMMGETFKYVAPVAGALKFSIQDTAVAIGLMANAGIKGSQSGTALRSIMSRLTKPTSEVQGAMEKLGLSITHSDGNMKSFREIMVDIRSGFAGLSTAEQASVAASLAGQEAMSGLLAIANAAPEDFEKLTESIENSAGAADRMAETRIDNLAGDFTLLQSAAEGAGIGIYQTFNGILREGVQGASQLLNDFTESDFLGNLVERMPTNRRIGKEIGEFVKSALEPLIAVGNWFWQHPDILAGSISGIGSALLTFKAAEGATSLIRTVGSLAGMIGAWPVAAAGVVVGGIVGISTAIKKANWDAAKANLARHFGKISLSMEELDETAKAIVANKNMEKASQAIEELGKIKELSEDFFEADKNLDRLNWKIGMGFELSEGDQQEYADAIDSMVRGSIDIVEQAQYTATISVQALFGESQVGNSLITGFNEVYEELNADLAALGKELGDVYSAALEDGVIDIDEAETIQEIQRKMSEITQKVAQAEFDAKLKRLGEGASGGDLDAETFKNTQAQVKEELAAQEAELGQATDYALAASELRYSEGKISKEEYDKEQAEIMQQYQTQQMMNRAKGLQWSSDTINRQYDEMFQLFLPGIDAGTDTALQKAIDTMMAEGNGILAWDPNLILKDMGIDQMDQATRDAIAQLWDGMEVDYGKLQAAAQEYLEAGKEIPQEVADGLADASLIGAIAGNQDAIWQLMALSAADNPEFQEALNQARENGYAIPEEVAAAIDANSSALVEASNRLGDRAEETLQNRFDQITISGKINFNMGVGEVILNGGSELASKVKQKFSGGTPAHYAEGGLIRDPTLSYFAEDGPEMAIPINRSERSLSLWEETGRLLGAYEQNNYSTTYEALTQGNAGSAEGKAGTQPIAPPYSPVINIYGSADRQEVEGVVQISYEQFVEYMERYSYERARSSL